MKFIDNDLLQLNVIVTNPIISGNRWTSHPQCVSCNKKFQVGDTRIHWRLRVPTPNKYHAGSFWSVHCPSCAVECINLWIQQLYNVNLTSFLPVSQV